MTSFTRDEYRQLFDFGRELYNIDGPSRRREIAVTLMAMAESCIGQQVTWPIVNKHYRHLARYEPKHKPEKHKLTSDEILAIKQDTRLQSEIAAEYRISQTAVSRIKARARWADL